MNDSKISVRYAKALFESAQDKKVLDTIRKDMDHVAAIATLAEFRSFLENPVMKGSEKQQAIKQIFSKDINELSLALLQLVLRNGRESYIPSIARNFGDLHRKHKGIKTAMLRSASSLEDSTREKIIDIIKNTLNAPIELKTEQDKELIGGFIIRIEDQQYDASVSSSLKKIKKALLN